MRYNAKTIISIESVTTRTLKVLTLAVSLSLPLVAQGSLDSGLVAFYPFNGNANDSSGNGNHGTVYGATLTTDRSGNTNNAYNFDGANDYISANDNDVLDITASFSIGFWLKPDIIKQSFLVSKHTPFINNDGSWGFLMHNSGQLQFVFQFGGTDAYSQTNLQPNVWTFVTFTYNHQTNTCYFYINGTLDVSSSATSNIQNTTKSLYIGSDGGSYSFFDGNFDEIRIYNRALTATEIQTLYNDGPSTPQNLTATAGNAKVTLRWDEVDANDLAKYRIYRDKYSPPWTVIDSVMASSPPDTFYVDNNVENDTTYFYRVVAVDSAGQQSDYSHIVEATPTDKIIAELLTGASSTSTGGQDQGYPLNTYYHDVKHQSMYHNADLSNAGLSPGATITAVEMFPSQSPGQDLAGFRVATAWTTVADLSNSFEATTVGYGPVYHYPADFPMGAWVQFPITPIMWDGSANLVVEFSHDNNSYTSGGGVYLREAGANRGRLGWSDSGAGSYPFDNTMSQTPDSRVAALSLVYTLPAVLPPTNLALTPSYQQVDLSWTASTTGDVARYIIYRGLSDASLDSIGFVDANTTTYSNTGLTNGVTYWYAVKAKNTNNEYSAYSNIESAVPQVAPPKDLVAQAGSQQVALSWTAATGSGVAKTLLYKGFTTATMTLADSTGDATTTTKVISGLENGTPYYFTARSKATDGSYSVYADTVSATPNYLGPTFWVATTGSNSTGDGSSDNPFATIQHAIDEAVSGDTVRIKPGTYSGWGNYDIDFMQKNLVVMGHGGADSVALDVNGLQNDRRRGFKITNHPYSSSAKIVGLTIINGFAPYTNDTFNEGGGGILLQDAGSLQVENCVIGPGNRAGQGAGIAVSGTNATISGTVVKGNNVTIGTDFFDEGLGVGIFAGGWNQEVVTIRNCIIRGNQGSVQAGQARDIRGGGLYFNSQVEVRVINSLILNNSVTQNNSGGWQAVGGGAMARNGATAYFVHTTIVRNEAENTVESWNGTAGAIAQADPGTAVKVLNSIIWNNTAGGDDMFTQWEGTIEVNYSGLQEPYAGTSNITDDPLFTGTAPYYYALSDASSMIGAGAQYGASDPGGNLIPSVDRLGNPRPDPPGSYPDLGFLENSFATTPYPSAPENLTTTAGDGQVTISWTQHTESDVTGYGIYYGTSSSPTVVQDTAQGLATTSYTATGLNNNVTYYFRITAIDQDGYESGFSAEVTGAPQFSGEDIYVNDSATASNPDGSSLDSAFVSIQDAISASATTDGKRILVAAGTYTFDSGSGSGTTYSFSYSDNNGNQTGSFTVINGSPSSLSFSHSDQSTYPGSNWTMDPAMIYFNNINNFSVDAYSTSSTTSGTHFVISDNSVVIGNVSTGQYQSGWSQSVWQSSSATTAVIDLLGKQIVIEAISGSDSTIIDGQGIHPVLRLDATANEYSGYSNSTKFIGFTFTNGDDEEPLIYIEGPSDLSSALNWAPTFENCRFTNTTIDNVDPNDNNLYGVIEIKNAEPIFDGCEFRNLNTSINQDLGGGYDIAGPIRMKGTESSTDTTAFRPVFKNCIIAENSLVNTYTNNWNSYNFKGGAIYIGYGAIPLFENTRIDSNKIDIGSGVSNWGSHHNAYGGGIYVDNYMSRGEAVKFINTSISYNEINGEAVYGGGIFAKFPALEFTNALMVGNSIDASYANNDDGWIETVGGAIRWTTDLSIYVPSNLSTDPELLVVNSTIVGNSITPTSYDVAGAGGAGICRENTNNHDVVIFNSIITNNSITNVDDQTRINLATNYGQWSDNNSLIDYSIIEFANESGITDGDYLYDFDPGFTSNTNFSLSTASMAIGAGTDSYEAIEAPAFDYNNDSRPNPSGSNPDLGVYENTLSTTPYPAKPQNLTVSAEGDSTVTLSWTANNEDDLSEYKIYYGTSSATTLLDSVSGTPSYTATGLDNYTTYYFAVSAEDLDGYESSKSNEVSGTPKWSGPIWYVDANQLSGTGKDGSPTLPFREIQDAIDAVDPSSRIDGLKDTLLVLPGTYDRSDDQELYFKYTSGTNQGQPKNLVLKSRDGAATTILDGEGNNRLFNIVDKTDTTLQIIGFTILGGGENDGMGNAIKVVGQSYWDNNTNQQVTTTSGTTFKNCIIKENGTVGTPEASPVIYLDRAKVRFIDCIIENNHVTKSGFNAEGGAIRASGDSRLTIFRTKILDNSLTGSSTEASGAGVYMDGSGNNQLTVINSVIARNTATAGSGYPSRGAGITVGGGVATIINSTIVDNNNNDENQFENGAGVYITYGNSGTTTNFNLFNSIIYGNTPLQNQLQINGWLDINHFVSYSILQGGNVDEYEDGVFEANPEFSDNTYVLHERSPAIGAGETESEDVDGNVIYPPTNDLAGNGRPNPAGSNPDLGAYESVYSETPYPDAPYDLMATPLHKAVELNWHFPAADDVVKYYVYQNTDSTAALPWSPPVDTVMGRFVTRSTITGLTNETMYYYYVNAIDTVDYESQPSEIVSTKPYYKGPVWWVATNGSDTNNDGSENNPFLTIDNGIQMASAGDTVMVKAGTYQGNGNRGLDPGGVNMVIISESGAATTILDAQTNDRHFMINSSEDNAMQIVGFTFMNGSVNDHGGSMFIDGNGTDPTIKDCIFRNNETESLGWTGGAINVNNCEPIFENCTIEENSTIGYGGGIAVYGGFAAPTFDNCTIINNETSTESGSWDAAYGAGVYIQNGAPVFTDCIIDSNTVTGGGNDSYGGGIFIGEYDNNGLDPVQFIRCFIRENEVNTAGTFEANGGAMVIRARAELINCVISGNSTNPVNGVSHGGAIAIDLQTYFQHGEVKIINCTIADNDANAPAAQSNSYGGALYLDWDEELVMFNTVIWGNTAEVDPIISDNGANMTTNYNNIEDGEQFNWFENNSHEFDPMFTDASNGDYSLSNASFNIGAGSSSFSGNNAPSNDILGNDRPGSGGGNPDIGAYENSLAVSPYPAQVANLVGTSAHQQVILNWDANPESDISHYIVYQSTTQDFVPASTDSIGRVTHDTTTFTATGLINKITYYYRVSAVDNDSYEGSASFEVAVIPRYTGPVWYVDDISTNGEGSFKDPFNRIQIAIDSAKANTDTVMVLSGTYTGSSNRDLNTWGKNLVIKATDGAEVILDAEDWDRHFTFYSGEDTTCKIIGFTLRNGKSNDGGSIYIDNASPQIVNCTFSANTADNNGGAVYVNNSMSVFKVCNFDSNTVASQGQGSAGAVFIANFNNLSGPPLLFDRCQFTGNQVNAFQSASGGALNIHARADFINCLFAGNEANAGVSSTGWESSYGGGIYLAVSIWNGTQNVSGTVRFINCTLADNSAGFSQSGESMGGGIYCSGWPEQKITMFNSIIWGNSENVSDNGADIIADYNDVQNGTALPWFVDDNSVIIDPCFTDADNDDYSLSDGSPLIGIGAITFQGNTAPTVDILGNGRPDPSGSIPDLGAYENALASTPYPDPPKNLIATPKDQSVNLSWGLPDSADVVRYYVYMGSDSVTLSPADTIEGRTNTSATIAGLTNEQKYYFHVTSEDDDAQAHESMPSNMVSAIPEYMGPVWYVDAENGSSFGEGSSGDPLREIQDAIDMAVEGDTVLVRPGIYDRSDDQEITFYRQDMAGPKNIVLMSSAGADSTVIDGEGTHRLFDISHGTDTTLQIIGFTIISGGENDGYGSAIRIDWQSSVIFKNCIIENSTANGTGIMLGNNAMGRFIDCTIRGSSNLASDQWQTVQGGAFYVHGNSKLVLNRCRVLNNEAVATDGNAEGGAIYMDGSGENELLLINSIIADNRASSSSNAEEGSALFVSWGKVEIVNSTITDNEGGRAANIYGGSLVMFNSIIAANDPANQQLWIDDYDVNYVTSNCILEFMIDQPWFGDECLDVDPMFADTTYVLSGRSLAIGSGAASIEDLEGVDIFAPVVDIGGNPRPNPVGSNPDLGAYENALASTPYPDPPKNLTVEELHHTVALSWTASDSTDVTQYIVYMGTDSTVIDPVDTVLAAVTTDTISGLTNQTEYFFAVSSLDTDTLESLFSEIIPAVPEYRGPVWYVDDISTNGEGSFEEPANNIRDMIEISADGDTILLMPGTYNHYKNRNLDFQYNNPGSTRNLIVTSEKGPDSTIIDINNEGLFLLVYNGESLGSELIGLTFQNGSEGVVHISDDSQLMVKNCVFRNNNSNNGGAIELFSAGNLRARRVLFESNSASCSGGAIDLGHGTADIKNSIFYDNYAGCEGGAITLNDDQSSLQIIHSLFLENSAESGPGGVMRYSPNAYMGIFNSIFWDNTQNPSFSNDINDASIVDHCILQEGSPVWNLGENYFYDPMIVDPTANDFSLSEYSGAIGRGLETYFNHFTVQDETVPVRDYLNNDRPQPEGTLPDIGPIEHEREVQKYFVYQVSITGNDLTGDGLTFPFKTIGRGIMEANEFDTVEVGSGTYLGMGNRDLDFGGLPLVLRSSDGPDTTIIDCEQQGRAFEFSSNEGEEAIVQGFTIRNGDFPDGGGAVYLEDSSPSFVNMIFENNVAPNGPGGAVAANNSYSQFINCVFRDNHSQAGGAVYSLGGDLGFNHCTIVGNGAMDQAAITVEDGYLLVENSILWYNHPDPPEIATVGTGVAEVRHSNIMGGYDGDNNYNGRPCFEDGPNGDFHLEDWSLAIGWADTSSFVDFDIEGNIRSVSDTTWPDIGAFENTLAAPDTTVYTSVDWYVSTTGLDTDPGTQGLPFATLQRAADYGIWNDNVILLAGTYDQDMDTWGKDLIIRGDGTVYETVVTGRLSIKRGESPRISNLKFSGSVVSIDIAANSAPELSYLEFTGGSGATVLQSVHSMPILDHVTFADNTGDAILAADTSFVQVANSIFWNTGDHYSLVGGSTISIDYSRTDSSGTGNIVDEPDFQAVGDYQLMAYSLLVNAGDPTVVDDDGTITDIGVYPYLTDHTGPDWYVDATLGNDLNGTGSSDIPFASVQGGINFALTNDTVWISEGTYLGTANLRDYDIVLSGAGDGTIIDGDGLGPVLRIGDGFTSNTVVRDLIITGAPTDKVAIRIDASSPNLQNLWLKGNDGGVYIDGGNPTIEYCLITDNTGDGIIVDAVTIGSLAVVNNTIAGNGGTGIINNSTATVEVRNTILSANTGGSNSGTITATYSDVTGAGLMTDGNIDTDPLFVDAANGDYELQLLSPCVDTGDSTDTFDPDSTVRDMGALPLFRTFVGGNTDGNNVVVSGDTTIIVNTDLTIDENDSLIIEPGGTLYLGDGVLLTIDGTLDAFGLPGVPIRFQCLYPGDRFGGIKLPGGTTNRTDPVYSYLLVTDVDPDSIPVTVSGNASLEHVTIAGNGNPISLQVTNGGTVILNYSILEGETLGTIDSTGSFVNNPTAHFVDPDSVFELLPTSSAIDVGVAEAATNIDPDFTYSDAGAFYHDQSAYATNTATVLYPALGDTVNVSPDTSATVGLTVTAQMLNEFGNFKTNALINWTPGVNGSLLSATTDTTDLEGSWSNTFFTSTVAGDLNSFTVTSDGASGVSGSFQVVPGVPDSLFAAAHDSILTQLDTLTLAVSVFDQFDNLVSDGETVNWTVVPVTAGFVLESAATTTVNGVANVDLMTDPNTELAVGNVVRVQAESNGVTVLSETITIVPDDIYNLSMPESLTAAPIPLSADVASITITATMIDTFDNLLEGVDVSWLITAESSSDGALSNSITPTNAAGLAVVDLTTGTVTGYEYWVEAWINEQALVAALGRQANADAIRVAGIVTTTGKKGSVSTRQIILPVNIGQPVFPDNWDREAIFDLEDTTNVIRIIPGVPDAVVFEIATDTVMTQRTNLEFVVDIIDQFGNPVADGSLVTWELDTLLGGGDGCSFSQPTSTTTGGSATVVLSTTPTVGLEIGQLYKVIATCEGIENRSGQIHIVVDDPYNLAVDDAYNRTPVADANIVPLALTIIDTFENVLDAVPVYWSIIEGSGGSLINGQELDTTLTDVDGIATNTLTTSTLSGSEYRVRIWVENVGGYTFSRSIGGESVFKALPAASTGKMAFSAMPETALSALSAGSRTDFQLDDTTDVITVLAGAPVTITPEVMDTTYVVQGQTDSIEIEVTDQFGNLVSDDSAVNWNASTPANYNIDEQDNVTTDGKAELVLTANSDAPWLSQIDFDIVVTSVFDANHADKHLTYIVQDVIAPAAVTDLAITPAVWTPTNSFDLTWTNPTEHSGVAGAHYVIDMNTYYYQAGQGISSVADIALFDNGISTIGVWLEDNAANEDIANIDSLVAKWDNVAPDNFSLVFPSGGSWLMIADPVIEWGSSADGTAGLRYYRVVLDGTDYQVDPAVDTLAAPVSLTETSHTLTVFAVDSAYNETEMTGGQISFDVDFTLPEITHNQTLEGSVNSAVAITASFADPASGIARAELYYRKGGEMTWQSPVDMRTLNTYQIAGSFVTSVGMEYYLEAEDVAGNIRRKPAAGFYSIEISVASPGLSSTKIWPTGVPNGTSVSSYQLVSFPGTAANNTPTDILVNQQASNWGAYDNTKWKFFTYGAGDWIEFASITAINPGVGYFLIVKDAGKNISTGLTRSVETDQPFSISLPAGDWKFLGNPFDFDIPLPNVYDQDSVSMQGNANFYTWDGEWKAATRLDPWRGYIYKSASGGTLYINPRKANGGMAKILDNNIASLQDGEWLIDITAQNGYARDLRNRVGVLHRAQDTYDPLDSFEPPVLPGGVSLRIDNRDWPTNSDIYTTDIKSVNPEGSFWDMEVVASDVKYNVYLNFAGLEDLPEDYDIFLIDKSIGTAQNLRGRPDYYYAIGSANSTRKLRLVAGTEDFVNANNAGVALYPESYSLSQNFPNPFNPKTTILISVEDAAVVDLVVYNLLGEVVTTLAREEYLPTGYYNYIWAGKNDQGRRVASGIYFYTSRIKSPSGKVLLNSTKKMILVK